MENIGSAESKDKTTTTESTADSPIKPNIALADLLLNQTTDEQHIWAREASTKEDKDQKDKKTSSVKAKTLPHLLPELKPDLPKVATETPSSPMTEAKIEATSESASTMEAADVELAQLEPDEARAITEQYAVRRSAELRDEEASWPVDSPEQAAGIADAALMRKITEKLRDRAEADPEQTVAEAADEVIAEAGLNELPAPPTAEDDDPVAISQTEPQPLTPNYLPVLRGINPNTWQSNVPATPQYPRTTWGSRTITPIEAQYNARQAENRGLILGGTIGYLIGRRRGRIKTEKRLVPIQQRLEKQVASLHDTIVSREQQVRTLAAEKVRMSHAAKAAEVVTNQPTKPEESLVPTRHLAEAATRPELIPIPVPVAAERLQPAAETSAAISSPEKHVERMNQEELLKTAETVVIEGASLRQIYEARQVTEKGLRHIMTEYLKGGDVKKALDQELKVKELTYERDPRIRDAMSATDAASNSATTTNSATQASNDGHDSPLGALTAQVKDKAKDLTEQTTKQVKRLDKTHNPAKDMFLRTWVVLVILLAIIAVILLFR